ncbi:MAG: hypothetical protein L0H38_03435 [bacterium]|nr:hypothetical protein [bacterium]
MEQEKYTVIAQDWIEADYDSEGPYLTVERFTTQHLSIEALRAYINRVRQVMRARGTLESTEPDGDPYQDEVDQETYNKLQKSKNGSRRIW